MKQPDMQYFEERLLTLQEQIMGIADLVGDAAKTVELDQNRVGRLSRMDAIQGQAMARASVERQALQLKLVGAALERIDAGEYGRCLECDGFIATGRLQVDPTVEYCISCAQSRENQ